MMKLNLGSGENIKSGFVNLDYKKYKGVDIVHDMTKFPYPFKDNTFNYIEAIDVLEHISHVYLVDIFNELYRILKEGGQLYIKSPLDYTEVVSLDPTHIKGLTPLLIKNCIGASKMYKENKSKGRIPYMNVKSKFRIKKMTVSPPFVSHLNFPYWFYSFNSIINNTFCSLKCILIKDGKV